MWPPPDTGGVDDLYLKMTRQPHYLTGYFITYLTGIGNLGILVQESVGHVGPSALLLYLELLSPLLLFLVLVLLLINDLF
jgi:hypothetical protein